MGKALTTLIYIAVFVILASVFGGALTTYIVMMNPLSAELHRSIFMNTSLYRFTINNPEDLVGLLISSEITLRIECSNGSLGDVIISAITGSGWLTLINTTLTNKTIILNINDVTKYRSIEGSVNPSSTCDPVMIHIMRKPRYEILYPILLFSGASLATLMLTAYWRQRGTTLTTKQT